MPLLRQAVWIWNLSMVCSAASLCTPLKPMTEKAFCAGIWWMMTRECFHWSMSVWSRWRLWKNISADCLHRRKSAIIPGFRPCGMSWSRCWFPVICSMPSAKERSYWLMWQRKQSWRFRLLTVPSWLRLTVNPAGLCVAMCRKSCRKKSYLKTTSYTQPCWWTAKLLSLHIILSCGCYNSVLLPAKSCNVQQAAAIS